MSAKGTASGLFNICHLTVVARYFKRRRVKATSFTPAKAGLLCLGPLVSPKLKFHPFYRETFLLYHQVLAKVSAADLAKSCSCFLSQMEPWNLPPVQTNC